MISGSEDKIVRVLKLNEKKQLARYAWYKGVVRSADLSKDYSF